MLFVTFLTVVVLSLTGVWSCSTRPTDVVFLLGSSDSIHSDEFDMQKEYVKNVVQRIGVGKVVRVAVVEFGDKVHPQISLGGYSGLSDLIQRIDKIQQTGGRRRTDRALDYAAKVAKSGRAGADRLIIVVSDGASDNPGATKKEAAEAQDAGIAILMIGVGDSVSTKEMAAVSSDPDNVFSLKGIDYLDLSLVMLDKTVNVICNLKSLLIPVVQADQPVGHGANGQKSGNVCGGKKADVFFALDASSSIRKNNFTKQLQFVYDTVALFDVGPDKTRVGLVTFSHELYPQFALTSYSSKREVEHAVGRVQYMKGGTRTDKALNYMTRTGFRASMTRPDAAKIAVVITDGNSQDGQLTAQAAR